MAANDVLASLRKNRERLSRLWFSTVNLTPNPLRKIIMELGFILLSRAYVKLSSMARGGGGGSRPAAQYSQRTFQSGLLLQHRQCVVNPDPAGFIAFSRILFVSDPDKTNTKI